MIVLDHPFWRVPLIAFAALATFYFGLKLFTRHPGIDFNYFWLAGELWAAGTNPYSGVFEEQGSLLLSGNQNQPIYWAYLPNWWPLSVGFAQFPFQTAAHSWKLPTGIFILSGIAFAIGALRPTLILTLGFVGFTLSMSATALTLVLGQTSARMFLSACLFLFAWLRESLVAMVLALVNMALKPTFGVIFVFFLLPHRRWWSSLAIAGGVVIAMCLPALINTEAGPLVSGFLSRIELYKTLEVNAPVSTTGLKHLVHWISGYEIGMALSIALVAAGGLGLGLVTRAPVLADPSLQVVVLACLIAFSLSVVTFHSYDLIPAALLILLNPRFLPFSLGGVAVSLLAVCRSENVGGILKLNTLKAEHFPGSAVAALGVTGLALFCLIELLRTLRQDAEL